MGKYVIYTRVSTKEQGEQGVSLEAQLEQCRNYVAKEGGEVVGEYYDVKSGSSRQRPGLIQAVAAAKVNDAILVFAKFDRLARDVEYAFMVKNSGIELFFLDSPRISTLEFGIRAVVAQEERELARSRTKSALGYKKEVLARDGSFISKAGNVTTKLGNPDPTYALECARVASAAQKIAARVSDDNWMKARRAAEMQREKGDTLQQIADTLNIIGFTTRKGNQWSVSSIKRLLEQPIK